MNEYLDRLRRGVVLAELGGYGDGAFCARHGKGAALVMLGTYVVDAGDAVPYPASFVFKPGKSSYIDYLKKNIALARASGALVGISVVSINLADTLDFLETAQACGADYVSFCAHSTMKMFVSAGASSALCRRENWPELRRWTKAMRKSLTRPIIFKMGAFDNPDAVEALEVVAETGMAIVHLDVENTASGSAGLEILGDIKGRCPLLIASGGIRDGAGARRTLKAGADAVAIGTAALKNPDLCGRIQGLLGRPG